MTSNEFGRHPGRATGKGLTRPKGRQAEPAAVAEVAALISSEAAGDRTLLIEHLHSLQDSYGHISARHLAALAEYMRLSQAEVYEVASFYHAFDVVKEDAAAPPARTVRVCESLVCAMAGAHRLIDDLDTVLDENVRVQPVACLGRCESAPVCSIGEGFITAASQQSVLAALADNASVAAPADYIGFDAYCANGGYDLLRQCLDGERTAADITGAVEESGLRGLGGAGFPTGRKWGFVRAEPGPRYLVINGDESEPGTFKDRHYIETDPHRFIEGMLIAAWAIEAVEIYLYIRNEYPHLRRILQTELAHVDDQSLVPCPIQFRRGAGAYICGEESAMLESLEGKRGLPRHKPPFPAQLGLFAKPTLINNIETLYWVPDAIRQGAEWNAGEGLNGGEGLRSYSVSGRIREPGVKLAPAGITVRELIDEHSGGMQSGHEFRAYLPGGASGGIFPADLADLPLDFGSFEPHGGLIGSAAIIVLSEADPIPDVVRNLLRFFADESCGQCTPCRVGTEKAVQLMTAKHWDIPLLTELAEVMADGSICGLGQAAANPIRCAIRYFREDIE